MNFYWTTERTAPEIVATVVFWTFFVVKTFSRFRGSLTALGVAAAILRIVGASLLVVLFLDPTFVRTVAEKSPITIVLDDSASAARSFDVEKTLQKSNDVPTVWAQIVSVARIAESTARRFDLPTSFQTLSGKRFATSNGLPAAARFETSPLRDAAKNFRRTDAEPSFQSFSEGAAPRRVLFLSDGIENGSESFNRSGISPFNVAFPRDEIGETLDDSKKSANASQKPASSIEIDSVAFGVSQPAFDWKLKNVVASTVVYPNENASISGDLSVENAQKNAVRRAVVQLWERSQNEEKVAPKLLWKAEFDVETDEIGAGIARVEHSWTPRRDGVFEYSLFVSDVEDSEEFPFFTSRKDSLFEAIEFCLLNNEVEFSVVPKTQPLAVLLIDDEPRYEYRYLRDLLRREETVSLETLLLSADAQTSDGETAISFDRLDRRSLAKFDVVIVGDVSFDRWNGRFERLVDVVLNADSSTSVWFLGGERTSAPEFWQTASGLRLVPDADIKNDAISFDGATSTSTWRPFATPRGRAVFPELSTFFDSLDAATDADAPLELSRVASIPISSVSSDVLLTARSNDGREKPLFVVAAPGKNKILRQATDELWRLRTLDDKTVYRRFILQTLEFLTDSTPKRERDETQADADVKTSVPTAAPQTDVDLSADDSFFKNALKNRAKLAFETSDVAAKIDVLQEISESTGGAFLDLRDLPETATFAAATDFFERRFADVPSVFVEKRTRFISENVAIPLVFLLFFAAWTFEFREEKKNR